MQVKNHFQKINHRVHSTLCNWGGEGGGGLLRLDNLAGAEMSHEKLDRLNLVIFHAENLLCDRH